MYIFLSIIYIFFVAGVVFIEIETHFFRQCGSEYYVIKKGQYESRFHIPLKALLYRKFNVVTSYNKQILEEFIFIPRQYVYYEC